MLCTRCALGPLPSPNAKHGNRSKLPHLIVAAMAIASGSAIILLRRFQSKVLYAGAGSSISSIESFRGQHPNAYRSCEAPVKLPSGDSDVIDAILCRAKTRRDDAPTLLLFHGNSGSIVSSRTQYGHALETVMNMNVLYVDYRGYGGSQGTPSERALQEDGAAALTYLQGLDDIDKTQIVLLGFSLGGAVATHTALWAQERSIDVKRLVLLNTFASVLDLVDDKFPRWLARIVPIVLTRNLWPTIDRLKRLDTGVLLISGDQDPIVDPSHATKMKDARDECGKPTELLNVEGGDHNGSLGIFLNLPGYEAHRTRFMSAHPSQP